ncbi:MAG TPA: hypothetical protein PKD96_04650 [Candidatus Absconditabacterales bacterium]|nr:hypothetical protein [Candidatus Absconditabacterales bacterium]HMT27571.1 hypothetical protein [Candidatus Absconditabacterales bacterium]
MEKKEKIVYSLSFILSLIILIVVNLKTSNFDGLLDYLVAFIFMFLGVSGVFSVALRLEDDSMPVIARVLLTFSSGAILAAFAVGVFGPERPNPKSTELDFQTYQENLRLVALITISLIFVFTHVMRKLSLRFNFV